MITTEIIEAFVVQIISERLSCIFTRTDFTYLRLNARVSKFVHVALSTFILKKNRVYLKRNI